MLLLHVHPITSFHRGGHDNRSYPFTEEDAGAHMGMSLARVCTAGEWQRAGAPAYVPSRVECQGRTRWG